MKILLVEDDRKLARALTTLLDEEGHEVETAFDGERGLELGLENGLDVIILDWMLPLMDGIEVCRTLRANRVEVPVLMLTARTAVGDRVEGLDAGADDYLPKPFAFRELMARLRALTRRQIDARQGDRLSVDGLELDLRRRRAEFGDRSIDLSPTEFALLEVLMRNEGRGLVFRQAPSSPTPSAPSSEAFRPCGSDRDSQGRTPWRFPTNRECCRHSGGRGEHSP